MRLWPLLLLACSSAFGQTVEVELDGENGYTLSVRNIDLTLDVASVTMELVGGGQFDWIDNATETPPLGGNNNGAAGRSATMTVVPDSAPISPGESWSGSGDIDGGVSAVNATVTLSDGRTLAAPLTEAPGDVWTVSLTDALAPPPGPDFADMCADGPALADDGCQFWPYATIFAYVGVQRTVQWEPHPDDMFRRATMLYFVEIRSMPAEILVAQRQTDPGEEEFLWTPGTAGHYHAKAMACDPDLIESGDIADLVPSEHCSDWADSLNDADTPPDLPGWMVYAAIRPPTGGGIE